MRAIMTCLMLVLVLAFAAPPCNSATNDESFIEGAKNIQKPFFDPEGYWTAVYIMPNVIGYNTRMVKRTEVPKTDEDLLNPKWKGKMGMDNTKPEWFAWKLKRMGEEKGLAYMRKLG